MKTIAIEFKADGKRYHFNTDCNDIKENDLVAINTPTGLKIVRVVDTDIEYDSTHKNIMNLFRNNMPDELSYYTVYEIVEYNNKKYKNILVERYKKEYYLYVLNNILKNSENKNIYVTDTYDTYKANVSINDTLIIDFKKIEKEHDLPCANVIFNNDIINDDKYLRVLNNINTSFIDRDEQFTYHPIKTVLNTFKDCTGLKLIMNKVHDYEPAFIEKWDFDYMKSSKYEHHEEFIDYFNKLNNKIEERYYEEYENIDIFDDYEYMTYEEYLEYVMEEMEFCDEGLDFFENKFNILAYEQDGDVINPVLKFQLIHENNTSAYKYDLKFQTLDIII